MFDSASMAAASCNSLQDLQQLLGQDIYISEPIAVDQAKIDLFAQATGDFQWIHVDPERAGRESPFAGTIAHGFLTLSLMPLFFDSAMRVANVRMGVNYGVNKVRFTDPVPVGSRLRARIQLKTAEPLQSQGYQMTHTVTVEREGSEKPVCVAETIARRYV